MATRTPFSEAKHPHPIGNSLILSLLGPTREENVFLVSCDYFLKPCPMCSLGSTYVFFALGFHFFVGYTGFGGLTGNQTVINNTASRRWFFSSSRLLYQNKNLCQLESPILSWEEIWACAKPTEFSLGAMLKYDCAKRKKKNLRVNMERHIYTTVSLCCSQVCMENSCHQGPSRNPQPLASRNV